MTRVIRRNNKKRKALSYQMKKLNGSVNKMLQKCVRKRKWR